MFKLPPSPTSWNEGHLQVVVMCFMFLVGLSFLKTLKSSLPCHTLHLTFHFLMTTFNNLYHPEFPLSIHIYLLSSRHFRFLFSSEIGFHASEWILSSTICVCLAALTSPILLSITLLLCSLLSKPLPPSKSHARSLLYVHTVPFVIQSCTLASGLSRVLKSHFPLELPL